jgi:hypothetical protein
MVEVSGKVIAFLLFLFLVTVTIPQILKTNATSAETISRVQTWIYSTYDLEKLIIALSDTLYYSADYS